MLYFFDNFYSLIFFQNAENDNLKNSKDDYDALNRTS